MDILIYGAGVLGSLYAAKLREAGHTVSLLARGQRLTDLREHGLVLENVQTGERTITAVRLVETLEPDDWYDLVIVLVRKDQLDSVLPVLAANRRIPHYLFMVNNAAGPQEIIRAVGRPRVLLGFPGAGGVREDYTIRYAVVGPRQPTTLGELDGRVTIRLQRAANALREAGFPVAISHHMDAWLKTHVALVSPAAAAIHLAGGSVRRLAHTPDALLLMVRAVRESFQALHALNIPVTPVPVGLLKYVPEPFLLALLRRSFDTPRAELLMEKHAITARTEMRQLMEELVALTRQSNLPTPSLDRLSQVMDVEQETLPAGSATMRMDWRGVWALVGGLSALLGVTILLRLWRRGTSH